MAGSPEEKGWDTTENIPLVFPLKTPIGELLSNLQTLKLTRTQHPCWYQNLETTQSHHDFVECEPKGSQIVNGLMVIVWGSVGLLGPYTHLEVILSVLSCPWRGYNWSNPHLGSWTENNCYHSRRYQVKASEAGQPLPKSDYHHFLEQQGWPILVPPLRRLQGWCFPSHHHLIQPGLL